MKLKLLVLLIFLYVFIVPAQLSKHEKHDKHHKNDKKDSHEKHKEKHGHKHEGHRGRAEAIIDDYDEADESHDDENEERGQWLFQLQGVRGGCSPNPCLNNGVCEEKKGKFKCKCPRTFGGRRCENGKKPCKKDTCGYGQCVLTSTPPFFECKCKTPFKPPNCKKIAPCDPSPCKNGGTCVKDGQDFYCACDKGFTGKFCQVVPNDCYEGDGESYRGKVSETEDGDDCLFWNAHFLLHKGINPFINSDDTEGLGLHNFCRNPDGETKPWCFTRKGKKIKWDYCNVKKCETDDVAPCDPSPCLNGGRCVKDEQDFICVCNQGFTGKFCQMVLISSHTASPTVKTTTVMHHDVQPTSPVDHTVPENNATENIKPTAPSPESNTTASFMPVLETTTFSSLPAPALPDTESQAESEFKNCGKPQPRKPLNRIYGGLKAIPGAQPWQASVQVRPKGTSLSFKHVCGGILIKSCWVLTAGHCIDKTKDYRVVLGGVDLQKYESPEQEFEVVEAILHEQYSETPTSVYNDIGLLRLKAKNGKCAEESQFVKTACLPTEPFPDGTECSISGWGATEDSHHGTNQLLDAEVLLISQDACSSDKVYGKAIENSMFCAGYLAGGVDSCQGDSGGPLTCVKNQTHYVYGIVSWGDNCGEKNKPGVYTRVPHFLDWINTKTKSVAHK